MAAYQPTSTAPANNPANTSTSTSTSIFSRRPSLFGGKHKTPKQHTKNNPSRSSILRSPTPALAPAPALAPILVAPVYTPSLVPLAPTSPVSPTAAAPDSPPPSQSQSQHQHQHHPHQYDSALRAPDTPPKRRPSRHSIASTVGDISLQLRRSRSASLRTNASSGSAASHHPHPHAHAHRRTPSATNMAVSFSPEKTPAPAPISVSRPTLSISTFSRSKAKSSDNVKPDAPATAYEKAPLSALDKPKTPFGMAVPIMPMRAQPTPKDVQHMQHLQRQQSNLGLAPAASILASGPNGANPNIIFQHIHEMASKRISTLDYLRKAHEGRIYWFNTLLFSKTDLNRLPSFTSRNQARRATQYLLLGFSLPAIIDLNANSPTDFLKALNALLTEFEQYQAIHPADGSTPSSLSRARIPQMFKRANLSSKGRRSSSATGDFPLLTPQTSFSGEQASTDSPPTDDLLPNESYIFLQTPSLPFDPDFFSTFATLCDVLIDCYTKMLSMMSTPESVMMASGGVPSAVGDLFNKADTRVRKILLAGVVREFEDSCRAGLRSEVGGVGKVVLGGLM